jgi:hypothetical protein
MNHVTKTLILVIVVVCASCITQGAHLPETVTKLRPCMYASTVASDLPLPTPGYRMYVMGEVHGTQEIKSLLLHYVKALHETAGVCDIILEEDQVYEQDANEYVLGLTDTLRQNLCLRTDILEGIREYNETLPGDEKIYIHCADVDSPRSAVHLHIERIHKEMGAGGEHLQVVPFYEFESWSEDDAGALVDSLLQCTDDPSLINQLETVRASLRFFFSGNRFDTGAPIMTTTGYYIREETITQTILYVLEELDTAPFLAFFGSGHTQKTHGYISEYTPEFKSWTQRLVESGVSLYSVSVWGLSGTIYWRGGLYDVIMYPDRMSFGDGTTLCDLFDAAPEYTVVYVDLLVDAAQSFRLGDPYEDIPAADMYDGIIIFREDTPMEDACP